MQTRSARGLSGTHPLLFPIATLLLVASISAGCRSSDRDLSVDLSLPGESSQPFPEDCFGGRGYLPDDVSLADELFTAQTDDLIFSKRERNSLAEEIAEVLSAVRASEPKLAGVSPLPDYDLRAVYIGLTADSVDTLIRNIGDGELFGPVLTGIAEVDSLNSRLGLKGFWVLGQEDRADIGLLLCLGDRVNIPVAVEKYAMLDAVATADHSGRVGDASDIGMEKVGPEWYMLADLASGDCPAGCTEHEFFHFRVSDGSVHSYTEKEAHEKEAHEIAIFDRLREDYLR